MFRSDRCVTMYGWCRITRDNDTSLVHAANQLRSRSNMFAKSAEDGKEMNGKLN